MNIIIRTKGKNMRRLETIEIVFRPVMILLFFNIAILGCSCNETAVEVIPIPQLSVEDKGVTELWLRVSMQNSSENVTLKRDDSVLAVLRAPIDTVMHDEGLLPHHTYTYKAERTTLSVTTMDTTSHNFTWTFDRLGDGNASYISDVAIVNDSIAFAVGRIQILDSTDEFVSYNAAKWDGKKWTLMQIPTRGIGGRISFADIRTIYAFSENDFWTFSNAGSYSYWNGVEWKTEYVLQRRGGGRRYWGTSSSNMYLACTGGGISHYDGTNWKKLESGTRLDIHDIWGEENHKTGELEVLAVASDKWLAQGKRLLKISGDSVSILPDTGLPWSISGIWFESKRKYYIVGSGVFRKTSATSSLLWVEIPENETSNYYTNCIRGQAKNDLITGGAYGEVLHYNGIRWTSYQNETYVDGEYYSVAIKGNLVILGGYDLVVGMVAIGRRR